MTHRTLAAAPLLLAALLAACGGGGDRAPATATTVPTPDAAAAQRTLAAMMLAKSDIGDDYAEAVGRASTNDEAAAARPDREQAAAQFRAWGRVLGYETEFNAPPSADLLFNNKTARVMNSATLFTSPEGASSSLAFIRDLPPDAIAAFISQPGGAGGTLSDTTVQKDIAFGAAGDESFAWRIAGKAAFASGLTVNYVADAVFLRAGDVAGSVITVALGQPPDRAQLESLVAAFVKKARAAQ